VVPAEGADVLSGHLHVRAPGRPADRLLIRLDQAGINAGSGAACSSGSLEPSHVLLAAGYSESEAKEGLRFTLGPDHPDEEIDRAARLILACL
ncbi:MAG: hypothetical protein MH204_07115, partial [Fimbriimonadaceae bacterium]|nr:hypothetical protein [Fimbriimonadaceae bacterium]